MQAADIGHDARLGRRNASLRKQEQQSGEKFIDLVGVAKPGQLAREGKSEVCSFDMLIAGEEMLAAEAGGVVSGVEAATTTCESAMGATTGIVGVARASGFVVHNIPHFHGRGGSKGSLSPD